MPHVSEKLHTRRRERVVLGELEFGGEHAAFEGSAFRSLDQTFPVEEVVFGNGAGGDAIGRVVGQGSVFLEETPLGGGCGHGCGASLKVRVVRRMRVGNEDVQVLKVGRWGIG